MDIIRVIVLAALISFAFSQGAVAAPEFYGPRGTIPRVGVIHEKARPCGPVLELSSSGPRPRYVIARDLGPCPGSDGKRPSRWAGPRATIPIHD